MVKENLKALLVYPCEGIFTHRGPLSFLKDQTATIIRKDVSIKKCQKLMKQINTTIAEAPSGFFWQDNTGSDTRIISFERFFPSVLHDLRIEDKLEDIASYTGRSVRSYYLMANRVIAKQVSLGSGGGFHRDSAHFPQIKYIWYLNNVNSDTGAFEYVKGSNRNSLRQVFSNEAGRTRFEEHDFDTSIVDGNAGDCIIVDTKCIHRGRPMKKGARHAITLYTSHDKDLVSQTQTELGLWK